MTEYVESTGFGLSGLRFFSTLYGLDWIATVPRP
jgi:hypothetical protein